MIRLATVPRTIASKGTPTRWPSVQPLAMTPTVLTGQRMKARARLRSAEDLGMHVIRAYVGGVGGPFGSS
jgi:hypothetical protein